MAGDFFECDIEFRGKLAGFGVQWLEVLLPHAVATRHLSDDELRVSNDRVGLSRAILCLRLKEVTQ